MSTKIISVADVTRFKSFPSFQLRSEDAYLVERGLEAGRPFMQVASTCHSSVDLQAYSLRSNAALGLNSGHPTGDGQSHPRVPARLPA